MTTEPVIQCQGLTKVFKDFWMRPRVTAVRELDLTVRPREVFGLLGPNGSGKSTTIKVILGLLYPTKGRVSVFGKRPSDTKVKERIGYLPEESHLYRFLNARETLEFYGRLFDLDRASRRKRIDMLLEMVGLEAVQRRPVGEYSKGMQRRIGLAQALINDPDLLILDEPTTGLDPIGSRQIKDLILMLRERGKTVLLCSHLLTDVEDVCDRVTVLYGGRKHAIGTVEELLTVSDSTVVETERLEPELVERIKEVVVAARKEVRKVEAPRKKLEALFLDIVRKAQEEGEATSGARSQGRIAEFLAADAKRDAAPEGRDVIEGLVEASKRADEEAKASEKAAKRADAAKPEADAEVIQALTSPKKETAPASPGTDGPRKPDDPAEAPESAGSGSEDVDRSVIDGLLGKREDGDRN
jgi:ABC-2 type transport system ATP-binding protein